MLRPEFIQELLKGCLRNREILETCIQHLEYHFIPSEAYKDLYKSICTCFKTSQLIPTIGTLSELHKDNIKLLTAIVDVKDAEIVSADQLYESLETYVKKSMFVSEYERAGVTYNKGDHEGAYEILFEASTKIHDFSLKQKKFEPIFEGFEQRNIQRILDNDINKKWIAKIPIGIDAIDNRIGGGVKKGDTCLFLARSGVGKTKCLRHIGKNAALCGFKGLHVQGEGSKDECTAAYDADWTGQAINDIEIANISQTLLSKLKSKAKKQSGEVFIESYEQFDTATYLDIRKSIVDCEKANGKLDFIIIDYASLFDPGNGKKFSTGTDGEKARRQQIAKDNKNLAVEFNLAVFVAEQASDVPPADLNNPDFVLTRHHISADKNFLSPFSYVFSINQTNDEYEQETIRLWAEKIRHFKAWWVIRIKSSYGKEKFYDRSKTISAFGTDALE